ncbi:ring canal kelch homolog [Clonorchis sinensis]|uniref:Ring canal kelch homolog n=1 Tax=Clonorchis sinensis TaxID=79923 RepID=G7Y740_CLOSI|nr:ring canal kelch homolog [Clonorchis sinensis]
MESPLNPNDSTDSEVGVATNGSPESVFMKPDTSVSIRFPTKFTGTKLDGDSDPDDGNSGTEDKCKGNEVYSVQLTRAIDDLRRARVLCDVVLQAGTTRLPAHRAILASSSPYFYAMFAGPLAHTSEECLELHGLDGDILALLVDFIYTGEIVVTEDNVQALLPAANLLQLILVRNACCKFLQSKLHPSNCLGFLRFADLHNCRDLYGVCRKFAEENYLEVFKDSAEFLTLTSDELETIISSDDLLVDECQILQSLRQWEDHDPIEREQHIKQLYRHVRFPLISHEYLLELYKSDSFLASKPWCKDYLLEAFTYQSLSLEQRLEFPEIRVKHRAGPRKVMLVFGDEASNAPVCHLEIYDFLSESWGFLSVEACAEEASNFTRKDCAITVVDSLIYVLGGYTATGISRSVDIYDPNRNVWKAGPNMLQGRYGLAVCSLNGSIYAAGGSNGVQRLESAEVLNLASGRWSFIAQMPSVRFRFSLVTMNQKIFAVGGLDCPTAVDSYHPLTDSWTALPNLPLQLQAPFCCTLGDQLYAVGGYSNHYTSLVGHIYAYSEKSGQWNRQGGLTVGRKNAGGIAHEGCLYVVGGEGTSGLIVSVEKYDPSTNTSTKLPKLMKFGRTRPKVVIIDLQRALT